MQRVPVLTAAAAATVLLCLPAVAGAQVEIKTTTGGPLTTQTAGSNGTAALNNLTFKMPGAVIAKYGAIARLLPKVVNPILAGLEILAKDVQRVDSREIANGSITPLDLSAGLRATLARADEPITGQRIVPGAIGIGQLAPDVRDAMLKAGVAGPQGPQGPQGAPGTQGAPGAPGAPAAGGPLAYARVHSDGTVDSANSLNIEKVSSGGGIYCLRYTGGTPRILNATLDVSGAEAANTLIGATADASTDDWDCTGGANIEVVTAHAPAQSGKPAAFYITVVA